MKIENDKDFKTGEILVQCFRKVKLDNFIGEEAFKFVNCLEWLVKGMNDFKNPPQVIHDPIAPQPSTIKKGKGK